MNTVSNDDNLIQRAYLKIKELESSRNELLDRDREPIAVIGLGCRFPAGLNSPQAFFEFLTAKESTVGPLPERLSRNRDPDHPSNAVQGSFFERVDLFDPSLFRISPKEARYMDPQQRFLLEVAWETLESAACPTEMLTRATTGVFIGITGMEYSQNVYSAPKSGTYGVTGITHNAAAGRLSFALGLRGPTVAVDAACASSLVAVDQAVSSLRRGACDYALAGGVNLILSSEANELIREASMLSPSGACHTFDASADGYVRGEGCGLVLLKPLARAVEDQDPIYAVIRGTGVNSNGTGGGFTVPNGIAQEELIRQTLKGAGIEPDTVDYVEAHGTGTALGDPIELNALQAVFSRPAERPLLVGSVKTNLGHLESAAGIAGLIKAILALHHEVLPPQIHFDQPNPEISWDSAGLEVLTAARAWNRGEARRRCGVSSFGISGTNAHLILEEAPFSEPEIHAQGPDASHLLLLSAHDKKALQARAEQLIEVLARGRVPAHDLCHTLMQGRTALPQRLAIVGRASDELKQRLRAFTEALPRGEDPSLLSVRTGRAKSSPGKTAFLYTGQGSQYPGMGRELYESDAVYREAIDRCAASLDPLFGRSLTEWLYGESVPSGIHRTEVTQPCLFATEYALGRVWRHAGLEPSMVLGHSLGEYVAALEAGVFSLEDALGLVAARGGLMGALPTGGGMATVFAGEQEVRDFLTSYDEIAVAAINGDAEVVVSGPESSLTEILPALAEKGLKSRSLKVSHAFHSAQMESILKPFAEVARRVTYREPTLRVISNVTGRVAGAEELMDPMYWVRHLRQEVRFADGFRTARDAGCEVFVELGPNPVLSGLGRRLISKAETPVFIPSLRRGRDARTSLHHASAELFVNGFDLKWPSWGSGRRVALPTYPFQRESFWLDSASSDTASSDTASSDTTFSDTAPDTLLPPAALKTPVDVAFLAQGPRPAESVLDRVSRIVAGAMEMHPVNLQTDLGFFSLGADSVVLMQIKATVDESFGTETPRELYFSETTSIDGLVDWLAELKSAKQPSTPPPIHSEAPTPAAAPPAGGVHQATFVPYRQIPDRPRDPSPSRVRPHWQREFLPQLVQAVSSKTAASKNHTQEYRQELANNRNIAGFRAIWKEMTYQIVVERSRGSKIWDVDGNQYIDLTMGFGVSFFGHDASWIRQAVENQLQRNFSVGPIPDLAGDVARRICRLTGMERAAFYNSGTEAVMVAVRLARTVTRRDRIVIFAGSYHGMFDGILALQRAKGDGGTVRPMAPGIPQSLIDDVVVLDYDSPESLEKIRQLGPQLAAVLVEPVQSRRPDLQPRAFLHELRRITQDHGCALIFDEIVTGFRTGNGGAQEAFDVRADIATYGKVIGGGLPMGVVAGSSRFLDAVDGGFWRYGDDSVPRQKNTFVAGTFCYHPLAMAAAQAVLVRLEEEEGRLQQQVTEKTAGLCRRLNAWFEVIWPDEPQSPLRLCWFGSLFRFVLDGERDLLFHHLLAQGIYVWEGRNCFLSTAHDDNDIDRIQTAVQNAVRAMAEAGLLPALGVPSPEGSGARTGDEELPLLHQQKRLWFLHHQAPDMASAYHENVVLRLRGPLDLDALRRAAQRTVRRHQALRIRYLDDEKQIVAASLDLEIPEPETGEAADATAWLQAEINRPFDLQEGPFFRIRLLRIIDNPDRLQEHRLLVTFHHLIADGWSMGLVLREISDFYNASLNHGASGVEATMPTAASWTDFVTRNVATEASILDEPPGHPPAPDGPDGHLPGFYQGRRLTGFVDDETRRGLRTLCKARGVGLFSCLAAGFLALIHRASGERCLTVGMPYAGHLDLGLPNLVGPLAEIRTLQVEFESAMSYAQLIGRVHRNSSSSASEAVGAPRWMFNLDRAEGALRFKDLQVDFQSAPIDRVKVELGLNVFEYDGELLLELDYRDELLTSEQAQVWMDLYVATLKSMVVDDDRSISVGAAVPNLDLRQPERVNDITPAGPAFSTTEHHEILLSDPSDPIQTEVLEVWRQVFRRPDLPADASFFELGGNSLAASRLIARIRQLSGLDLRLRDLFEAPTAAALARLGKKRSGRLPAISPDPAEPPAEIPLSNAQHRLWIAHHRDPESTLYNMSSAFLLEGELDTDALHGAFAQLVERHESLRSYFTIRDGEPWQRVGAADFHWQQVDLKDADEPEAEARRLDEQVAMEPYSLEQGPLFRVLLLEIATDRHVLAIDMHHIIGDGWSMDVLLNEMVSLYNAHHRNVRHPSRPKAVLTDLPIQYRHYVSWLDEMLQGDLGKRQCQYWRERLASPLPQLDLPLDFPRPERPRYQGATLRLDLDSEATADLHRLARDQKVSPFLLVCSAVRVLLYHQTGNREMLLGTPFAGRTHPDLEQQIGFFLNTLVLRGEVEPTRSFANLLQRFRLRFADDFDHGLWPFDRLVEDLGIEIEPGRHPLFDVLVLYQHDALQQPMEGIELTLFKDEIVTDQFDLTFQFEQHDSSLRCFVRYDVDLFRQETILGLTAELERLLKILPHHSEQTIHELCGLLATDDERLEQEAFLATVAQLGDVS